MVSIKDFAREHGVTYEAVRKQIKRYAAELDGHIHQQGRTQYLDDVAVAFLSDHRAPAPMAIYTEDAMVKQIQKLEAENKELLQNLNQAKDRIIDLQDAQARLEAAEATQRLLTESADAAKAEAARNAQKASEEAQRADQAIREAQELRSRLEASEAREKALEDKQREFEALPFWKKPFWKG